MLVVIGWVAPESCSASGPQGLLNRGLLNLHSHARKDAMDKLVRRVTVVQGSGETRQANVVYKNDEDDDEEGTEAPRLGRLERGVRHMLKAQVIAAQEAYQRHLDSVKKGGNTWFYEDPGNFMKARRKALKEMRKASPFRMMKFDVDDDEDENEEGD
jgi:hypothetical protein